MRGLWRVLMVMVSAIMLMFLLAAAAYAVDPACYPWDGCKNAQLEASGTVVWSEPFDVIQLPNQQVTLDLAIAGNIPYYWRDTRLSLMRGDTEVRWVQLTCSDIFTCNDPEVTFTELEPGPYRLRIIPNGRGTLGKAVGYFTYRGEGDPRDDRCQVGEGDFETYVVPGYNRWGNLEFSGDEDWQTIASPAQKKMLLALNLAGNAEAQGKNYDLSLWSPDCTTRLAISRKDDPGVASADRVLVDVAPNAAYRSQVTGSGAVDFETTPEADYQQAVWFGNVNRSFQLYHAFCYYDPHATPEAPGGYLRLWARVNNQLADFRDLTLYTTYLPEGQKLAQVTFWQQADHQPVRLAVDDPAVNGVGATVSVPNLLLCHPGYPSALCRLDKGDSFSIELAIGLARTPYHPEYCIVDMDLYGNPVLEFEEAAAAVGDLEAESIHMQSVAAPEGSLPLLHLPFVSR